MGEAATASPVKPGDVLAGKYAVERVLGAGGMGVVVAARHLDLDERVAIKFLLPEAASKPEVIARFLQEGRAAAKIKSEHIAQVKDVGRLDDGVPYLVMEYLEGEDVAEAIARAGALSYVTAAEYIGQAIEALAEAHAIGIVHRDLKPANLFVSRRADGSTCIKVLDFGIAKALEGALGQAAMTNTTSIMGSPLYMPPEQLTSSRNVDTRADIWSLGVILFEMVTGQLPFVGDTIPQLCASILSMPPGQLGDLRADAPPELAKAIRTCLQKDPNERYANVADLADVLALIAPHAGESARAARKILESTERGRARLSDQSAMRAMQARTAPTEAAMLPVDAAKTDVTWQGSQASPRGMSPLVIAGSVIAVLALGGVATLALRSDPAPAASSIAPQQSVAFEKPPPPPTVLVPITPAIATTPSAVPSVKPSAAPVTSTRPVIKPPTTASSSGKLAIPGGRK